MSQLQDYLYKKILTFHKKVVKKNEKSINKFFRYFFYAILIDCVIALLEYWLLVLSFGVAWAGNKRGVYSILVLFSLVPFIFPMIIFLFSKKEAWKKLAKYLFVFNLLVLIFLYMFIL